MKEITCQHCQGTFRDETKKEILNILYVHYMKDHNSVITRADENDKNKWMERFESDWVAAKEEE